MSGIAEISGSCSWALVLAVVDLKGSAATRRLEGLGARIWIGHHKDHLDIADVVVFSSAVTEDNPEIVAAKIRWNSGDPESGNAGRRL